MNTLLLVLEQTRWWATEEGKKLNAWNAWEVPQTIRMKKDNNRGNEDGKKEKKKEKKKRLSSWYGAAWMAGRQLDISNTKRKCRTCK